jgi:hypothetical protein
VACLRAVRRVPSRLAPLSGDRANDPTVHRVGRAEVSGVNRVFLLSQSLEICETPSRIRMDLIFVSRV